MATKKKAAKPAAKKSAPKAAKSAAKKAPAKKAASNKGTKYVYTWGAGKADGDGGMKALLGGKGANLAEMTRIGLPVPPGFTITTEVCTYFYANKKTYPSALQAPDGSRRDEHGENHGLQVRRCQGHAAARRRAFRRARLDARHDGHHPQPRPQRPDRHLAGRRHQERALRLGLLSPLRPDVWRRRARRAEARRRGPRALRSGHRRPSNTRNTARTSSTPISPPTTSRSSSSASRRSSRSAPARASRAIRGSSSAVPPAPSSVPG